MRGSTPKSARLAGRRPPAAGRCDRTYRYHDLIKAYTRRQARLTDGPARVAAVLGDLVEFDSTRAGRGRGDRDRLRERERPAGFDLVSSARAWLADTAADVIAVLDQADGPSARCGDEPRSYLAADHR
jgi:hypothetical protein